MQRTALPVDESKGLLSIDHYNNLVGIIAGCSHRNLETTEAITIQRQCSLHRRTLLFRALCNIASRSNSREILGKPSKQPSLLNRLPMDHPTTHLLLK